MYSKDVKEKESMKSMSDKSMKQNSSWFSTNMRYFKSIEVLYQRTCHSEVPQPTVGLGPTIDDDASKRTGMMTENLIELITKIWIKLDL